MAMTLYTIVYNKVPAEMLFRAPNGILDIGCKFQIVSQMYINRLFKVHGNNPSFRLDAQMWAAYGFILGTLIPFMCYKNILFCFFSTFCHTKAYDISQVCCITASLRCIIA